MKNTNKVLVIEDDKDINELIVYNLRRERFLVERAFDGEEGLVIAERENIDLIILDLMLPNIDGYEVLKILKEDNNLCDIPVIILSAKVSSGAIIKAFKMGAIDYVPKPFAVGELVSKIKAVLEKKNEYSLAE